MERGKNNWKRDQREQGWRRGQSEGDGDDPVERNETITNPISKSNSRNQPSILNCRRSSPRQNSKLPAPSHQRHC